MKSLAPFALAAALLGPVLAQENPPAAKPPAISGENPGVLTVEQQKAALATRTSGVMWGTFDAYAKMLRLRYNVAITSDEDSVLASKLSSPYPEFYKPTCAEVFDVIARQTQTSWNFDPKGNFWRFGDPVLPLPFTLDLAKGWQAVNRGNYLFCKPPGAQVGLEVYVLGSFSADQPDPALAGQMREAGALFFAQVVKKDATVKEMSMVQVGPHEALHYTVSPKPGITWRQWVITEGGRIIAITSALEAKSEAAILPDVEAMAKTLKIIPVKP